MNETIDLKQHIVELLNSENPAEILQKLKKTYKIYPIKKIVSTLIIGESSPIEYVMGGENTKDEKEEYLMLLETMLPDVYSEEFGFKLSDDITPEETTALKNRTLIKKWIQKEKEKLASKNDGTPAIKAFENLRKEQKDRDESKSLPVATSNYRVIIQWNEQKNVLTDIFRQLRQIHSKDSKPAIGNSIPEVALFLKENFSCFEKTALGTIEGMLKNNEANSNTPKTSRQITIEREKL